MLRVLCLWLAALSCVSCSQSSPVGASPREVTVFAATSLRDALQEIAPAFEKVHNAKVVFAFGSSGDLSKQIVAADRADAFLSADEKEMDSVAAAARIEPASRRDLLANQLVVIEPVEGPSGAFAGEFARDQLSDARIGRWSLANVETVPAGRYAKTWLTSIGAFDRIADRIVPAVDVRAALAAVESGGCQAGIVYRTDAARSRHVRVVFTAPEGESPDIRYPGAVVTRGPATDLGAAFLHHLATPGSRAVFERHGFVVLVSTG